jgi:tyrosyl-tRNA synthetase
MNFVDELRWRGMIHDIMPGTEELLSKEMTSAYVGIDPTASSLHIGHLVSVMMLKHFQCAGHKPIALVGGATGMIGDPSGKSDERNLLDEQTLNHNVECIKNQLSKFLDFDSGAANSAELVNNLDWMKDFSFLGFIRDIGKYLTVNYMMAKDSVKKRLGEETKQGMSFTEFSYQLVQGADFLHLYQSKNCKLQMGGSDQWGNITTGTELIRKKLGGEAFALTCPLITKADGGKFGKTESGNVWLDPQLTSAYSFYQFWLNVSDTDAARYIKIFTMLSRQEIADLETEQAEAPQNRPLQKKLAQQLTCMVHSDADYKAAKEASSILFGNAPAGCLSSISKELFLEVFAGVPQYALPKQKLVDGINIVELLAAETAAFPNKSEVRRAIQGNALSINKEKVCSADALIDSSALINGEYILAQKGKKNYMLIRCE